jgi:hypothetical protein
MRWHAVLSIVLVAGATSPAAADPWKDESGHGRRGREWKQEFHDGNCKIERKWEKDGGYKEERKCSRLPEGSIGAPPPLVFRDGPHPLPPPPRSSPQPRAEDLPWLRERPPSGEWQNPR